MSIPFAVRTHDTKQTLYYHPKDDFQIQWDKKRKEWLITIPVTSILKDVCPVGNNQREMELADS